MDDSTWGKLRGVLAACADVDEALLYGSRAKGSFKPGSDIDLALKGEHLDLKRLSRLSLAIDDLLLPQTVDLAILHRIRNQELLDHIHRVGKPVFRKQDVLSPVEEKDSPPSCALKGPTTSRNRAPRIAPRRGHNGALVTLGTRLANEANSGYAENNVFVAA